MDGKQNQIINCLRELEDVGKEHWLFNAYSETREAFLEEPRNIGAGKARESARRG